jgi:simple sugar transport system permease protein
MRAELNQQPSQTRTRVLSIFEFVGHHRQTILLVVVFIALFTFFSMTEKKFLTTRNLTSMGFQLPEIGVLSLAMMITILTGGINLSVNATSNMSAVIAGLYLVKFVPKDASESQIWFALIIAMLIVLFVGLISGLLNGFLIGYIRVPPILATLATMTFFTGISTGLTGGATVTGFPEQVAIIGSKTFIGVPIPFIIFFFLTVLMYVILTRTSFGFKVRMLGTNPVAANFTGIDTQVVLLKVYALSGILASITGVLIMGRTMSAAYEYGTTTYVLLTILIAVLAGVVPGFGSVVDVFIAVLILQVLSSGFTMQLAGIRGSSFFKDFAWGVLLILIFIINYLTKLRTSRG